LRDACAPRAGDVAPRRWHRSADRLASAWASDSSAAATSPRRGVPSCYDPRAR
jgi:hypothetical protein